ncbi:SLC13 family permease [Panacagrimonas sp.]|uniref:SLC13 family permease n=1 Tax=Panacagrimonas sp. TaxID=2480088 RepID=UPI003B51F8B5
MLEYAVFAVLLATLGLFVWDRFRYDAVALAALLALVLLGAVPPGEAFNGFAHPAVVTVAAVLVISRGLANAGVVDLIASRLSGVGKPVWIQVASLGAVVALLSAFMNNVGALALLMPVAMRMARERQTSPSNVLMPLAFASLLGGLITLIGTPPNLIVSSFRAREGAEPFSMFDFAPVGLILTVAGVVLVALLARRLIPQGQGDGGGKALAIQDYLTELRLPEDNRWVGKALGSLAHELGEDVRVAGLVRGERRVPGHSRYERLESGDMVIVEADAEDLKNVVEKHGFELAGRGDPTRDLLESGDLNLAEAVVQSGSRMAGQSARSLGLRIWHGLNLLAVSRQGQRLHARLGNLRLEPGDVVLLEGDRETLPTALQNLGCLPLADRELKIGSPSRLGLALGLFVAALAAAATDLLPAQVSLSAAALTMAATGMVSAREAYQSIEWPIVVLLAAMIPVGMALETSGGAASVAGAMSTALSDLPPELAVGALIVVTMLLSNVVNNAAAAVLMCPIALGLGRSLEVQSDPLLMAVAVGASCAFLTPIGHQSNTLVLGPGGYRFRDYWPLGLPLSLMLAVLASLTIPMFWAL